MLENETTTLTTPTNTQINSSSNSSLNLTSNLPLDSPSDSLNSPSNSLDSPLDSPSNNSITDPTFPTIKYEEDVKINSNSPKIKLKLKETIKIALISELFIIILILISINILYFSTYHTNYITRNNLVISIWLPSNTSSNGIIEESLTYVVKHKNKFLLNYSFVINEYDNSINDNIDHIKNDVQIGKYWGAFYVIDGASEKLMIDMFSNNPPLISCGYIYDQVRAGPSFQYSLGLAGVTLTNYINSVLKSVLLPQLYGNPSSSISYINSGVATKPVNTITTNLHPVSRYGMFSVIGDGTMQLFLNGMYHGLGIISVHSGLRGRGIDKGALVGIMGWHRVYGSAFLAIWPVVVPLILNPNDSNITDNVKLLFQWWAFVWLELAVFSGMNYHIAKLFGGPMGLLVGLSTLMLMVASGTASLPYDAMPKFYQVGYAFPFYSAIQGARSILYGSQKQLLGLCLGILFIWWGVMFVTITCTRYYLNPYLGFHLFEEPDEKAVQERERERAKSLTLPQNDNNNNNNSNNNNGTYNKQLQNIGDEVNESGIVLTELNKDQSANLTITTNDDKNNNHEHEHEHEHDEENDNDHKVGLMRNRVGSTDTDPRKYSVSNNSESNQTQQISKNNNNDDNNNENNNENNNDHNNDEVEYPPIVIPPDFDNLPLSDPSIRPYFRIFLKKAILFEIALSAMMIILLLLSYGNVWNPFHYHYRVELAMVNLDSDSTSSLSPIFQQTFITVYEQLATSSQFGFNVKLLDNNDISYHHAIHAVDSNSWKTDNTYWGILILHNGSAHDLQQRLTSSTYKPPSFPYYTFVYNGANDAAYLNANLRIWASTIYGAISYAISKVILSENINTVKSYQHNVLSSMTSFAYDNLHPYPNEAPALDSTINLAILILYLGMITNIGIITASHAPFRELGVKYETRMIFMTFHIAVSSLILSFFPVISLVWYGYHIDTNTFFQYWAVLWLGMCGFGSVSTMISYFFGPIYGGIISIIIFSLNSAGSSSVVNNIVQPSFYWIGLGLPYHNIITTSRYILFKSNYLAFQRSIGILIAWVGIVFIGVLTMAQRRKNFLAAKHKIGKINKKIVTKMKSFHQERYTMTATDAIHHDDIEDQHQDVNQEINQDQTQSFQQVSVNDDEEEKI